MEKEQWDHLFELIKVIQNIYIFQKSLSPFRIAPAWLHSIVVRALDLRTTRCGLDSWSPYCWYQPWASRSHVPSTSEVTPQKSYQFNFNLKQRVVGMLL